MRIGGGDRMNTFPRAGDELLLLEVGKGFTGEDGHALSTPSGKSFVSSGVQVGLLQDFCFELLGDNVEEHPPCHRVSVLQFRPIGIEEFIPPINVGGHLGKFGAPAILAEDGCAGVGDNLALAGVVFVESPLHAESVGLLALAAGELETSKVQLLGEPVDQHLFQLQGKINRVLVQRPEDSALQGGVSERVICLRHPSEKLSPERMNLRHVIDDVLRPS